MLPRSSLQTSPATILIVDDDASVRRALKGTLQTLDFSTAEASRRRGSRGDGSHGSL